MIPVDASVALKWFLIEDGSREAVQLAGSGERLGAPDLIIAEVCSGAWKSARLGRLTSVQVAFVAAAIPKYFSDLVPGALLAERAVEIAAALDHPVYDCFYLALAERLATPLITADTRLLARLRETPWQGFAEALT